VTDTPAPRRSTHIEHEVVYAAIGASGKPDLLEFPPEGSTPFHTELKVGSGPERYLRASNLLMTWGALRGSGAQVLEIEPGDGGKYVGVSFDANGVPRAADAPDVHYAPDGAPFLTVGTLATVHWDESTHDRRVRVVYTIDEDRRAGYALGSVDAHGAIGEYAVTVEHRDDDSVWAVARGCFWPPSGSGRKGRAAIRFMIDSSKKQLAALAPGAAPISES